MKIHWLQHVLFEGLGCIESWLEENGHEVSCTQLWKFNSVPNIGKNDDFGSRNAALHRSCFPNIGEIDGLIVMGGPMGINDDEQYPWLAAEKAFIKQMIAQNKPVLGICLGAQLIADVLGAEVRPAKEKEIGFFPISGNSDHEISKPWKTGTVFHWHGDTFDIPDGAVRLASSEVTENQAFVYNDNVLALQFHLETTGESLLALYENGSDEIANAPFIQTLEKATALRLANGDVLKSCNNLMRELLDVLFL